MSGENESAAGMAWLLGNIMSYEKWCIHISFVLHATNSLKTGENAWCKSSKYCCKLLHSVVLFHISNKKYKNNFHISQPVHLFAMELLETYYIISNN